MVAALRRPTWGCFLSPGKKVEATPLASSCPYLMKNPLQLVASQGALECEWLHSLLHTGPDAGHQVMHALLKEEVRVR
eukprot:CAMPEP_0114270008 /NCGR_PEP_ID=MMETSP0058-20121206/26979_1 /TAXON_ID=36894 /ORGANISM="Pyramimonas parkeae, CCMP726" /LENGTH=77 /DNA_ID=CAMNT_0001388657 /DNA_START=412 /DNA_END=645 /DNA_ORIENTATION=-